MALSSPKEIAAQGEKIYKDKYQADYERSYRGDFVVIDIKSGDAFRAQTPEDAMKKAQQETPDGLFHLIKVGAPAAFHVSKWPNSASADALVVMKNQREQAREIIEFYGNAAIYEDGYVKSGDTTAEADGGKKARDYLKANRGA
jgi:hypothetical protein